MRIHDPFDVMNREPTILFIQRRLFLASLFLAGLVFEFSANLLLGVKTFVVCWVIFFLITLGEPKRLEILKNTWNRKAVYDAGRFDR